MELRDDRANYPVASRADIALLRIIDCEFKKRPRNWRGLWNAEAPMYSDKYFENLLRTKSQLNFPVITSPQRTATKTVTSAKYIRNSSRGLCNIINRDLKMYTRYIILQILSNWFINYFCQSILLWNTKVVLI